MKKLFSSAPPPNYNAMIQEGAIILDVRTPREFQSGHIKGSKNIPVEQVKSKLQEIKKWNKPIITVCRSGNRSGVAKSILLSGGVETVNGGPWNVLQQQIQS
ncbi:MAG: rhodanese-like domain-containing protein [Sediminibacterium sp.]|nr:rhodanese-like domain-containing protein [Sediminibacterium sp.]